MSVRRTRPYSRLSSRGLRTSSARGRGRVALAALLSTAVFVAPVVLGGCGGGTQAPVSTEPQLTEAEIRKQQQEQRLQQIQAQFTVLDRMRAAQPDNLMGHLEQAKMVLFNAKGTSLEKRAQQEIEKCRRAIESLALEQLDGLKTQAQPLVEQEEFDAALDILNRYEQNAGAFQGTEAWSAYQQEVDRLENLSYAASRAGLILSRSAGYARQLEYAKALGMLIAYPDRYKGTKYYEEIQERIDEYMDLYLADRAERQKTLEIEWQDLPVESSLAGMDPYGPDDTDIWNAVDGVVEGDNSSDRPWPLMIGDMKWVDFIIELELQYDSDDLCLGVTGGERFGRGQIDFPVYRFKDVAAGEWIKIRCEVSEGMVTMIDLDSKEELKRPFAKEFPSGGFVAWCLPGQKISVRNIRYKVVSSLAEEGEGDGGGGDSDDGDADGDGGR